jgi:hypothetical protein
MTRTSYFLSLSRFALCLGALGMWGCADVPEEDVEDTPPVLALSAAAAAPSLCCGTKTVLAEGIAAAENLFLSSDDRLFASGDDGIYELVRRADGSHQALRLVSPNNCAFGGLTEARGVLYANCYANGGSYVYGMKLSEPPYFKLVATLRGTNLANGLTSDDAGHLYVACTGQNRILRLTLSNSNPFEVVKQEVWLNGSGLFTNGIKVYDGELYWTDFTAVKRAPILSDGRPGRVRTLAQKLTFLDDLYVDAQGVLVADWLGNSLRLFGGPSGSEIDRSRRQFDMPSAVIRANGRAGFSQHALIVAEKASNRVSVFEPR